MQPDLVRLSCACSGGMEGVKLGDEREVGPGGDDEGPQCVRAGGLERFAPPDPLFRRPPRRLSGLSSRRLHRVAFVVLSQRKTCVNSGFRRASLWKSPVSREEAPLAYVCRDGGVLGGRCY
jgi:hypothetical protein